MRNTGVNGKGGDGRQWLGTLAVVHASATAASLLQCHLMFAVKYLQIRCHGNWGPQSYSHNSVFSNAFLCLLAQSFLETGQILSHIHSPGM